MTMDTNCVASANRKKEIMFVSCNILLNSISKELMQ